MSDDVVQVTFPVFGLGFGESSTFKRGVPVKKVKTKEGEVYVTTVFDLLAAYLGVDRGLGGDYPASYDDPKPFTPAWQEEMTGVSRELVIKLAREFADTSLKSGAE